MLHGISEVMALYTKQGYKVEAAPVLDDYIILGLRPGWLASRFPSLLNGGHQSGLLRVTVVEPVPAPDTMESPSL